MRAPRAPRMVAATAKARVTPAGVLVLLIGYELVRFATARESVRHGSAMPS